LFIWLVDKSKGARTERLAFRKPQLRRGVPSGKNRLPLPMMKGSTKNRYSSIRSVPISDWTSARAAIDDDVFARLLLQFGDFFHHIPEMMVDSFQGAAESVVETTYLCIRLRIGPGPSPVVCLDQPAKAFHR
jgi:hypothetical protein